MIACASYFEKRFTVIKAPLNQKRIKESYYILHDDAVK